MTTIIRGYRAYVFDPMHDITDFCTFLTRREAEDWAAREHPRNAFRVSPMTVDSANASFSRLLDGLELAGIAVRNEDGTARPGVYSIAEITYPKEK